MVVQNQIKSVLMIALLRKNEHKRLVRPRLGQVEMPQDGQEEVRDDVSEQENGEDIPQPPIIRNRNVGGKQRRSYNALAQYRIEPFERSDEDSESDLFCSRSVDGVIFNKSNQLTKKTISKNPRVVQHNLEPQNNQ